jgi:hypothetical protein
MVPQRRVWVGLAVVLALAAPARAGEVDPYLPADTEVVVTLNVRQVLDSPAVKKNALEQLKALLKASDEVDGILKDLGFEPLKDLDRVVVAGPGGNDADKGLVIVRGKFDLAKFKAKADETLKGNPDNLKEHKVNDGQGGQLVIYEVLLPGEDVPPIFVSLASDKVMLVSPGKDYVVDALKKQAKKAPADLKSKELRALLEAQDAKQSVAVAVLGSALARADLPDAAKQALSKFEAIGGGVTIGDDIKFEVVGATKTAQEAKELARTIDDFSKQGLLIVGALAQANKDLAPVVDVLKTVRVNARDKAVTVKAELSAELLEKLFGKE